ncbi:MAG: zf-HC2 domain-containing protein [candidate division KSB1 bacterium]
MNTCEIFSESLSDYVENDVHPEQRKSLDDHLAQCPSCHTTVTRLQNLRSRMRALPRIKTSPDFETLLRTRLMLERKRRHFFPFVSELKRMPRTAAYALAGFMLLLIVGAITRSGQTSETLTQRGGNEDLKISSFSRPASNVSSPLNIYRYSLDQVTPASFRLQWEPTTSHERSTATDSSAEAQTTSSGRQQEPSSF